MTETVLGTINIEDLPQQEARGFSAVGIIGEVTTQEAKNDYLQILVPLEYRLSPNDTENRRFVARFNIRLEWLTPEFEHMVRNKLVDDKTIVQYNINVKRLLRGLFVSAGLTSGELNLRKLTGRTVGFQVKPQKKDPSRLEISKFFTPRL